MKTSTDKSIKEYRGDFLGFCKLMNPELEITPMCEEIIKQMVECREKKSKLIFGNNTYNPLTIMRHSL